MGNHKIIIASYVSERDGVGIEVYKNDQFVLEIFRDDTFRRRYINTYTDDVPLSLIEESIEYFKKNIQWDFIEYPSSLS